jgi:hypothetical protein
MVESAKLILMFLFAGLSVAAVTLVIVAVTRVGVFGFLPFSNVSRKISRRAAPYRKWVLLLMLAALLVCGMLAVLEIAVPDDGEPVSSDTVIVDANGEQRMDRG